MLFDHFTIYLKMIKNRAMMNLVNPYIIKGLFKEEYL